MGLFQPNPTYTEVTDKTDSEVIFENIEYSKRLGFETEEEEETLPIMYWTPKMHKTPIGMRYIIASKTCFEKPCPKCVYILKYVHKLNSNFRGS